MKNHSTTMLYYRAYNIVKSSTKLTSSCSCIYYRHNSIVWLRKLFTTTNIVHRISGFENKIMVRQNLSLRTQRLWSRNRIQDQIIYPVLIYNQLNIKQSITSQTLLTTNSLDSKTKRSKKDTEQIQVKSVYIHPWINLKIIEDTEQSISNN